jgi:hypothetical protein
MPNASNLTTPLGLCRYSHDYFDSSRALQSLVNKPSEFQLVSQMPHLYLMGRSLELALKAFLLKKGLTLDELRSKKYGHNLKKCFDKALELGLVGTPSFEGPEIGVLELLNELYVSKRLEYIETGEMQIPLFYWLQVLATKLIRTVSNEVGYSNFKM